MKKIRSTIAICLQFVAVVAMLSLVLCTNPELPAGETIGQWIWFGKSTIVAGVCILLALIVRPKGVEVSFAVLVSWALILLGGIEAIWGLRQLYGYAASGHSLYALTGSFFNPGPYSGYLAMVLPICFAEWLRGQHREQTMQRKTRRYVALGMMLLIVCVLPAAMSRSAWMAAGVSCLWVYACHIQWRRRLKIYWGRHRKWVVATVATSVIVLLLGGWSLFVLKPDSAQGRLFMWKITGRAIMESPWRGHGSNSFAKSYGEAQEAYFAQGDYEPWEERVAGTPEYAFNEYLHFALEGGIPFTVFPLFFIGIMLCLGRWKYRLDICGAIISLLIFSFSSYPMQIPVFIVTFGCLILACMPKELGGNWCWMFSVAFLIVTSTVVWNRNHVRYNATREWTNVRMLYRAGAYEAAIKGYDELNTKSKLATNGEFMFEYGHCLHKAGDYYESNRMLMRAEQYSNDPMILNIIAKNYQEIDGYCEKAESYLIRSIHRLPGRIYPYYLLAKLYADPDYLDKEKFEEMKQIVLTKEPKIYSTAIEEMREELEKLSFK